MEINYDLMNDFERRVLTWNGYPSEYFEDVHQIGEWQVCFRTPDGLVGIYDGLRRITRRVFDNFDEMDEHWYATEVACNIEHYMLRMGYSIEGLALEVGISPKTLYNYLNKESWPRIDILFRMAKVLDCTPDDLFYVESRYK